MVWREMPSESGKPWLHLGQAIFSPPSTMMVRAMVCSQPLSCWDDGGGGGSAGELPGGPDDYRGSRATALSDVVHLHRGAAPARRPCDDADLDVLAESGEEVHEALDREAIEAVAHQVGHVRLPDAEQLCGPVLREPAFAEDAVHLHGELHLEAALPGVRIAKVREHVAAACFHFNPLPCHSAPHNRVSPPSAARRSARRPVAPSVCRKAISFEMHAAHKPPFGTAPCTPPGTCPMHRPPRSPI